MPPQTEPAPTQPATTPPVTPQPNPQPVPPAASAPGNDMVVKKIKNAGTSTLLLGVVLGILLLIILPGVKTLPADQQTKNYAYFISIIVICVFWVVQGVRMRKMTDVAAAQRAMMPVIITALLITVVTVINQVITKATSGGLAGLMALVLAVYLLVARSGLKKASSK